MDNYKFEKDIKMQMEGFGLKPSDTVWEQVEKRIKEDKKRRFIFWWFFPVMIVLGGGINYIYFKENKSIAETPNSIISSELSELKKKIDSIDIKEVTPKTSSLISYSDNNDSIAINSIEEIPILDENVIINAEEQQVHIASVSDDEEFLHKDQTPIVTKDGKLKSIDTIIVMHCNENFLNDTRLPQKDSLNRQLNFNGYLSYHGSGDLVGAFLEFGKELKIGRRYAFYNNVGVSIHSGQVIRSSSNSALQLNSSYQTLQAVTVGVQTTPTIYRYSKRGDLKIGAGLVARYQMGYYNTVGAHLPTGGTQWQYTIYESYPNIFTIGYRLSVGLLLFERKKNKIGFEIFFQNDTWGETITGLGLSLQRTYKNNI